MASDDELGGESFDDSSPLSPLQQGMLFQSLAAAGADPNLIQITGELPEDIDPELFDTAWQKVAERHEVLRTSFHAGQVSKQRIHKRTRVPFVFQDFSGLPLEARTLENRSDFIGCGECLLIEEQVFDAGCFHAAATSTPHAK